MKYNDVSGVRCALRLLTPLILLTFLGLLTSPSVGGQSQDATLSGTVRDINCAPLADTTVRISHRQSDLVRQTQTDSAGQYAFTGLPAGNYDVVVTHDGFQANETDSLGLAAGVPVALNVQLFSVGQGIPGVITSC